MEGPRAERRGPRGHRAERRCLPEGRAWQWLRVALVVIVLAAVTVQIILRYSWVGLSLTKAIWASSDPDTSALLKDPSRASRQVPVGVPIPKILLMTYLDRSKIPQKVHDNLARFASGYDIRIAEDDECERLIAEHFAPAVLQRFRDLRGAHKADLYRYCALWVHGGVYCDIKTEHIMPLDQVIDHASGAVYTAIDSLAWSAEMHHDVKMADATRLVYQGFIAAPPHHPLFLDLIQFVVDVPSWVPSHHYLVFCQDMYERICLRLGVDHITRGRNAKGDEVYELFVHDGSFRADSERFTCPDGLDRYGLCLYLTDANHRPRVKVRYSDYPWHESRIRRKDTAVFTIVPKTLLRIGRLMPRTKRRSTPQ
jgi:hypothetical protein